MDGSARRANIERQAVERERQRSRPHVGGPVDRVGDGPSSRRDHVEAATIVHVDHRDGALGQQLEQPPLRGEVRLHVAVEIEVVARQVGEDAGGKSQPVDAAERERVRRDFHHTRAAAFDQHLAQHALQLGRFGRRARRVELALVDAIADRADATARHAGGFENRRQHVRGRRLAVRARDADEEQLLARIVVEGRRQRRQRRAIARRPEPGNRHVRRRRRSRRRWRSAPRQSPARANFAPSALTPRSATNTDPGRHLPRVVGDGGDRRVERGLRAGQFRPG